MENMFDQNNVCEEAKGCNGNCFGGCQRTYSNVC